MKKKKILHIIGRSDGTSAASGVISEFSAASEHSAAVIIRRSGTVAESGCICRIVEVLSLFDNFKKDGQR